MNTHLVAHRDWSKDPRKRWMAVAAPAGNSRRLGVPRPVGDAANLFDRLGGQVLMGFDFPIGLPAQYGAQTGLHDFRHTLATFGSGRWKNWYRVCDAQQHVSVHRPFYPASGGGRSIAHLVAGLGLTDPTDLLRRCDRKTPMRRAACSLFWTLGVNQVGKAAITGWIEVLASNLHRIALWPFDGPLDTLLQTRRVIVCETYPGEIYAQLGIPAAPV